MSTTLLLTFVSPNEQIGMVSWSNASLAAINHHGLLGGRLSAIVHFFPLLQLLELLPKTL